MLRLRPRCNTDVIIIIFLIICICFWIYNSDGKNCKDGQDTQDAEDAKDAEIAEWLKKLAEGVNISQNDSRLVEHVASIIEHPVKESNL